MDMEVTPVLGEIEDIDLDLYKDSLIKRFSNSNIKDQLSRICAESSVKIPKFLIPTIQDQLDRGGPIQLGVVILASWCRFLELYNTIGYEYEVRDVMRDELLKKANASINEDPLSFISIRTVFGDLASSKRFMEEYIPMINSLRNDGIKNVLAQIIN
jgi:mannitol 2-dehydrogenase